MCKQNFYGKKCNDRDCEWSEWTSWLQCPCGDRNSRSTRHREKISDRMGNGIPCNDTTTRQWKDCPYRKCSCLDGKYGEECNNRDCEFGEWGDWAGCTPCPQPCKRTKLEYCSPESKPMKQTRSRNIAVKQLGTGETCDGETEEVLSCGKCKRVCIPDPSFKQPKTFQVEDADYPSYVLCKYLRTFHTDKLERSLFRDLLYTLIHV